MTGRAPKIPGLDELQWQVPTLGLVRGSNDFLGAGDRHLRVGPSPASGIPPTDAGDLAWGAYLRHLARWGLVGIALGAAAAVAAALAASAADPEFITSP